MLKTPLSLYQDPVGSLIAKMRDQDPGYKILEEGVVEIGHFSLDIMVWGNNGPFDYGWPWFEKGEPHSYGVCDTPQQFLERYRKILQDDPRTFCMSFTHIPKNPGELHGWRWHKWGPYIGDGTPTTEYLADEPEFVNGVYCYHILQTAGPVYELDFATGKLRLKKDTDSQPHTRR